MSYLPCCCCAVCCCVLLYSDDRFQRLYSAIDVNNDRTVELTDLEAIIFPETGSKRSQRHPVVRSKIGKRALSMRRKAMSMDEAAASPSSGPGAGAGAGAGGLGQGQGLGQGLAFSGASLRMALRERLGSMNSSDRARAFSTASSEDPK